MSKPGIWRMEARRVIAYALLTVGPLATEEECRAACEVVYPWNRRLLWPRRCWLRELRIAMNERICRPLLVPVVFVVPSEVQCAVCDQNQTNSCIVCLQHRTWYASLTDERKVEWASLLANRDARHVLADWIEEYGKGLPGLAGGTAEKNAEPQKELS